MSDEHERVSPFAVAVYPGMGFRACAIFRILTVINSRAAALTPVIDNNKEKRPCLRGRVYKTHS